MPDPQPIAAAAAPSPRRLADFARRLRMASTLVGRAALAPVYRAYTVRLRAEVLARPVPEHVALIMDGNRRWARQLGGGAGLGHRHGANKAIELLDWCSDLGIREVTLWALSLENLDRAPEEVELITEIARQTLTALSERDKVKRLEMSLRVIGRRELLPDRLREAAERGEAETLAGQLKERLEEVAAAIARLDGGTYGTCEVCGLAISPARLEAMPATRFCIDHAARS